MCLISSSMCKSSLCCKCWRWVGVGMEIAEFQIKSAFLHLWIMSCCVWQGLAVAPRGWRGPVVVCRHGNHGRGNF